MAKEASFIMAELGVERTQDKFADGDFGDDEVLFGDVQARKLLRVAGRKNNFFYSDLDLWMFICQYLSTR